jgi:hypothetical protein
MPVEAGAVEDGVRDYQAGRLWYHPVLLDVLVRPLPPGTGAAAALATARSEAEEDRDEWHRQGPAKAVDLAGRTAFVAQYRATNGVALDVWTTVQDGFVVGVQAQMLPETAPEWRALPERVIASLRRGE